MDRRRLLFHLLLAAFLANAANKFFIIELDYELTHGFYERIFQGTGDAPDQYRILPLLAIKGVRTAMRWIQPSAPFNHAVMVVNFFCGFLLFEIFFRLLSHRPQRERYGFNIGLAVLYIYTLYTGWRPDSLALLLVCSLVMWLGQWFRGARQYAVLTLGIVALSFCRSDMAAIYAVFLSFTWLSSWPQRILLVTWPFAIQFFLQFYLFVDATYYTKPIMIWDNLSGYYLARNPASWLLAALLLLYFEKLWSYIRHSIRQMPIFYVLLVGYVFLVLFVGRLNEYRLYLPFIPLWMVLDQKLHSLRNHHLNTNQSQ
ncbi:MAG: hypothetical protein AAFV95_18885 [Bacteroidota bacterium]